MATRLVTAVSLRHLAPRCRSSPSLSRPGWRITLSDLGVAQPISTEALLGNALAKSLESPHAADGLLLGIIRDGTVSLGIDDDPTLTAGDRIVRVTVC